MNDEQQGEELFYFAPAAFELLALGFAEALAFVEDDDDEADAGETAVLLLLPPPVGTRDDSFPPFSSRSNSSSKCFFNVSVPVGI